MKKILFLFVNVYQAEKKQNIWFIFTYSVKVESSLMLIFYNKSTK